MNTNPPPTEPETVQSPTESPTELGASTLFARLCCNCVHYDAVGWGRKLGYPVCLRTIKMSKSPDPGDLVHGGKVSVNVTTCEKAREGELTCGREAKSFTETPRPVIVAPKWLFEEPECLRPSLMVRIWRRVQGYFEKANVRVQPQLGAAVISNEAGDVES
jgi:hypothetical protein